MPLQLLVNRIRTLNATFDARRYVLPREFLLDLRLNLPQPFLVLLPLRFDLTHQFGRGFGLQRLKRQVLQLASNLAHAETVRDGCVDFKRLLSNFLLAVTRQRADGAHVVQPVSQLDDDHANIARHGEQHLAQTLSLTVFTIGETDFAQLSDAINTPRNIISEAFFNLV